MKTAVLSLLLLPILLSPCAPAEALEKLLGNWDIDIERHQKNPELRIELEALDKDARKAFSKTSLTINKSVFIMWDSKAGVSDKRKAHTFKLSDHDDTSLVMRFSLIRHYHSGYVPSALHNRNVKLTLEGEGDSHMTMVSEGESKIHMHFKRGETTLQYYDPTLIQALHDGDLKKAEARLKQGADPNGARCQAWSPLVKVAATPNPDSVKFLLEHGADVNLAYDPGEFGDVGDTGTTALMVAVDLTRRAYEEHGKQLEIAKLLLTHGAEVNAIKDSTPSNFMSGAETALDIAKREWIAGGSNIDRVKASAEVRKEMIALLIKHGAKTYEELSPHSGNMNKILGDWEIDMEKMRKDPAHKKAFANSEERDRLSKMKISIAPGKIITQGLVASPHVNICLNPHLRRLTENGLSMGAECENRKSAAQLGIPSHHNFIIHIADDDSISLSMPTRLNIIHEHERDIPPLHFKKATFEEKLMCNDGDLMKAFRLSLGEASVKPSSPHCSQTSIFLEMVKAFKALDYDRFMATWSEDSGIEEEIPDKETFLKFFKEQNTFAEDHWGVKFTEMEEKHMSTKIVNFKHDKSDTSVEFYYKGKPSGDSGRCVLVDGKWYVKFW